MNKIDEHDNLDIRITKDGSHTIYHKKLNETYHSSFGAIQEAYHVFIKSGFNLLKSKNEIYILEIGFGTGLNAYITYIESLESCQKICYFGLEKHPIEKALWNKLNYANELKKSESIFTQIHECNWQEKVNFEPDFFLTKIQDNLEHFQFSKKVDLIYFDAFGPKVQPNLWTEGIFKKMYQYLNPNGILVTYSCKGDVKRAMVAAGFKIEKIPGPPGKREMLRAYKC